MEFCLFQGGFSDEDETPQQGGAASGVNKTNDATSLFDFNELDGNRIGGSGRERKARRRQDGDAIQTGCRSITCLDSSNKSINFSLPPFFWPPLLPPVRPPARPPQVQAHTRSGIFSASAYLRDGACNSLSARPALLGLFYFNPDEKDEEMIKSEGVGGE